MYLDVSHLELLVRQALIPLYNRSLTQRSLSRGPSRQLRYSCLATTSQPDTPLPFECSNTRFGHNSWKHEGRKFRVESFATFTCLEQFVFLERPVSRNRVIDDGRWIVSAELNSGVR